MRLDEIFEEVPQSLEKVQVSVFRACLTLLAAFRRMSLVERRGVSPATKHKIPARSMLRDRILQSGNDFQIEADGLSANMRMNLDPNQIVVRRGLSEAVPHDVILEKYPFLNSMELSADAVHRVFDPLVDIESIGRALGIEFLLNNGQKSERKDGRISRVVFNEGQTVNHFYVETPCAGLTFSIKTTSGSSELRYGECTARYVPDGRGGFLVLEGNGDTATVMSIEVNKWFRNKVEMVVKDGGLLVVNGIDEMRQDFANGVRNNEGLETRHSVTSIIIAPQGFLAEMNRATKIFGDCCGVLAEAKRLCGINYDDAEVARAWSNMEQRPPRPQLVL